MNRSPQLSLRCLVLFAFALAGCGTSLGVRKTNQYPLLSAWRATVGQGDDISPRTKQTLRRLDLETVYDRNPTEAYAKLHQLAVEQPDPDWIFALADMCYLFGQQLERRNSSEALAYYYLCAGYSYHFLFGNNCPQPDPLCGYAKHGRPIQTVSVPPVQHTPEEAFDPRFRLACDLYNNGLEKCIRAAQKVGRLDSRQLLHLANADGSKFCLSVTHHGFPWRPQEFGVLLFASDFQVVGLTNHYKTYGLGVPLIGTRANVPNTAPGHTFYPKEVSFPVTAFFRFEGTLADLGARKSGSLELYNPLRVQKIKVNNRIVPLERDLTTPLAYFLSRTDLHGVEYSGLLTDDDLEGRRGIYMFEPYQKGKIPVLMVHGLFSSPLTWAPLFNELRADPVLNEKYQFLFYLYPSSHPYLSSAAELRQALSRLRAEVDPHRNDPAFDQMIYVGHSMGGLIGKLTTQDSEYDFWHLASEQPFERVKATPDVKKRLHRLFFFEQQRCIKRVVFLGTPHRGSNLSPSLLGRTVNSLIRLPKKLMKVTDDLTSRNPGFWKVNGGLWYNGRIPTSIDLLSPKSPALHVLAERPPPQGVKYHSVIGVYNGTGKTSDDGVVHYSSAHVDGSESELLVPGHHIVLHQHPRTMLEVRRILYLHLHELDSRVRRLPVPLGQAQTQLLEPPEFAQSR
ncbi:MAG: esterase/lipase family protein [Gemmataceae bacterium]